MPTILIVAGIITLVYVIIMLANDAEADWRSVLKVIFQFTAVVGIPLVTINTIQFLRKNPFYRVKSIVTRNAMNFIGLFLGIFIGTVLFYYLGELFFPGDDEASNFQVQGRSIHPLMMSLISNWLIGLIISIPIFIVQSKKQEADLKLKKKELEVHKLERMKAKSDLETLQAKINPHFLYNSLNSVASLIHDNPDAAEKMVLSLSDLFRYSINSQGENYSSVKKEVQMVRTYLEVERIRFDDKLETIIEIDPKAESYLIPRFLIQPLIENAIKHGTSKLQDGKLKLRVNKTEAAIEISIYDNGPDFPANFNSGYGLRSTSDKLNLLFPKNYELSIYNGEDKHIHIKIFKFLKHDPS